ncbi:hypothetical protein [Cytophaga aurantiaca]|uniref:hypothetical protein n=1 Tax=Cytophaga aurantiaca TaxID=29530 RepID=UPI000382C5A4|nr:hypothetical protein [Cytophaga aurantiaca]
MKKRFLYSLIFPLGILLSINACTKKPESVEPSDNSFTNYFSNQRIKTQKFTFDASQSTVITGKKGTKVMIGAGTLRTASGARVTGNVTVELKEVTKLSEMIVNNAPTISNGKILTSGGEFYVAASQNGAPLSLANNASFFISVAAPRGTTDSMNVFTGRDSLGTVVWKPVQADTVNSNVTIPADSTRNRWDTSAYYQNLDWAIINNVNQYVIKCTKFGWINCDYFASYPDVCRLTIRCDTIYKTTYTKVYYTIPATNSVGNFYINSTNLDFFCNSIPNNMSLNIAALNYHDGKYYIALKHHVMHCGSNLNIEDLDFVEIEESQIESYLSQIDI